MGFKVLTRTHPSVARPRPPAPAPKTEAKSHPGHPAASTFEAEPGNVAGHILGQAAAHALPAAAPGPHPAPEGPVAGARPQSQPSGQQPILAQGDGEESL